MTFLNAEATNSKYAIMALDLTSIENSMKPTPAVIMTSESAIKSLTVNPFKSVILWTTSKVKGITAIFESHTDGTYPKSFLSRDHTKCNCSNCNSIGDPITFDSHGFNSLNHGVLITNHQSIYLTDDHGCECLPLINMSSHGFHNSNIPPYKLAANNRNVFWSAGYLYASEKPGVGITELKPSQVREITVLGPSSQPFPELSCLIPTKLEELQNSSFSTPTPHSLNMNLPLSKLENCHLPDVSVAALKYKVFYGVVGGNHISECTPSSVASCKVITTSKQLLSINDLHPFTLYTVFVTATNVYAEIMGMEPLAHKPIMLRTASGAPLPPKLLRLERLTPSTLRVVWRQPDKLNGENVWYEIHWNPLQKRISPGPGWTQVKTIAGKEWSVYKFKNNEQRKEFQFDIENLHPGCNYSIWVLAFSEKGDAFSRSDNKTIMTYSNPSNITLVAATPYTLNLLWIPPQQDDIIQHQIYYRPERTIEWNNCTEVIDTSKMVFPYNLTVNNLKPSTVYSFKVQAWFAGDPETPYNWPSDDLGQFSFKTLSDKPSTPGQPIAKGFGKSLYEVSWERSKVEENGPQIELYSLECRTDYDTPVYESSHLRDHDDGIKVRVKREWADTEKVEFAEKLVASSDNNVRIQPVFTQWNIVYNGTEPRWKVTYLKMEALYEFRVRAKNTYGWSDYSPESGTVSLASLTVVAEPQPIGVIFGTVSLAILILSIIGVLLIYVYRRNSQEKPSLQNSSSSERREVELATLRELPGGSNFIHQSNILYAAGDLVLDLELAGVPQIRRHHISFTKFLGSGAFGEVYEGIALSLPSAIAEDNRVAIKTLRKGASPNEKLEFIQEAKLMTQFRHPHILQLLGICVDTDPCCLLLELMDGGDLLSYLRSNRPHLGSSVVLRMCDLLKMCVDVAKGCVYLEDMHFVHRDIAARNCLVRIVQNQTVIGNSDDEIRRHNRGLVERVVKIGDFGLARDVYRNDYYRKEGEGLLPVRWMAPESLIDGVYTTQSDVWAFGVLLWEIMTLGQQPYPARNNLEVLQYVRSGGRLHQPSHCPDRLSHLMLQCWEFNSDNRPSFKYCLTEMEIILQDFQGELQTLSGSETKTSYHHHDDSDDVFPIVTVQPIYPGVSTAGVIYTDNSPVANSFPRYLEVISDSNAENSPMHSLVCPPTTDEGYEIPLPKKPPRNPKNIQLVSKLAPKSIHLTVEPTNDDIGVPSPTYWNTLNQSAETLHIFPRQCQRNDPNSNTISKNQLPQYHHVSSSSPPVRDCYLKSKSYLNTRRLGLVADLVQQDYDHTCDENPPHFRNLLASTTSEDADVDGDYDYSECDIGSSAGCVSYPHLKLHVIPDEGMEIALRRYEGNNDFQLHCNNLNTCGHTRVGRLPVSLSDSGNGSVDVDSQVCTDETENLRGCDSGRTSRDPEYLSIHLQTRNHNLDGSQYNNSKLDIAEDQSRTVENVGDMSRSYELKELLKYCVFKNLMDRSRTAF
ncbi:unnamed protein product [Allacma fusca]|uniref:receptor protein-tyrosine kinase n=1 Tax=Allacma fusca TaxID=39272 RepID=A0A8J2NZ60_9HEXA|nr:unnamed protein product [Allacma fusca]